MDLALTIGAESVAKAAASAIHFGATSNFTQYGVSHALGDVFNEAHPLASSAIQASAAAASLAVTHVLAEVVLRTALLQLGPGKMMEWNAEKLFPHDTAAQRSLKALQSASKIRSTVGNAVGLASFCIVQGSRSALGFSSPQAATPGSAIAGGYMAALHTAIGMNTGVTTQDGVFEHTHKMEKPDAMATFATVKKTVNALVTRGGTGHELAEELREIVVGRGVGAFLGLLTSLLYKARAAKLGDGRTARAVGKMANVADAANHLASNAVTLPARALLDAIDATKRALGEAVGALLANHESPSVSPAR
ncbi:MAG: hypothetical protein ACRYHA_29135 [Janthinobacterium lividum]